MGAPDGRGQATDLRSVGNRIWAPRFQYFTRMMQAKPYGCQAPLSGEEAVTMRSSLWSPGTAPLVGVTLPPIPRLATPTGRQSFIHWMIYDLCALFFATVQYSIP